MGLDNQMPVGKIGAKKQKRLEMKEEKRQLREVENYALTNYNLFRTPLICSSYLCGD